MTSGGHEHVNWQSERFGKPGEGYHPFEKVLKAGSTGVNNLKEGLQKHIAKTDAEEKAATAKAEAEAKREADKQQREAESKKKAQAKRRQQNADRKQRQKESAEEHDRRVKTRTDAQKDVLQKRHDLDQEAKDAAHRRKMEEIEKRNSTRTVDKPVNKKPAKPTEPAPEAPKDPGAPVPNRAPRRKPAPKSPMEPTSTVPTVEAKPVPDRGKPKTEEPAEQPSTPAPQQSTTQTQNERMRRKDRPSWEDIVRGNYTGM